MSSCESPPLADPGVVPQLPWVYLLLPQNTLVSEHVKPSLCWCLTGGPVKPSKPHRRQFSTFPQAKGPTAPKLTPSKGQIMFSVSASTVCEVKKATKTTHTECQPPLSNHIQDLHAGHVHTALFVFCAEGNATGSNSGSHLSAGPRPSNPSWRKLNPLFKHFLLPQPQRNFFFFHRLLVWFWGIYG